MAWQDETKAIIQEMLLTMVNPCTSGGSIGKIEIGLKKNLELSVQTIDKIQEHQSQIEELQAGDVSIPIKIWEGNWNSGTLIPSIDGGHIVDSGYLADYNVLIFKFKQGGESGTLMIPQEFYSEHNSNINLLNASSDKNFFNFYFNSAEELQYDSHLLLEMTQIWGIK